MEGRRGLLQSSASCRLYSTLKFHFGQQIELYTHTPPRLRPEVHTRNDTCDMVRVPLCSCVSRLWGRRLTGQLGEMRPPLRPKPCCYPSSALNPKSLSWVFVRALASLCSQGSLAPDYSVYQHASFTSHTRSWSQCMSSHILAFISLVHSFSRSFSQPFPKRLFK